jgi:arginyl-tRNA synthetase
MTLWQLREKISKIVSLELGEKVDLGRIDVSRTSDSKFGHFTTNAAMVFAKDIGATPHDVATRLTASLQNSLDGMATIDIAGPGFINFTMTDKTIIESALSSIDYKSTAYAGKEVVTEYSDANPFKVLHVGHLYTTVVGDAITNLIRSAGGRVHAVNFGGDVGLHVAKTMWAILNNLGGSNPEKLEHIDRDARSNWMAKCYVEGTKAYENDEVAKEEIKSLNMRVYKIHEENDLASPFAEIYWTCRKWSYDYFNEFYERIGSKFEKYYPESETTPIGLKIVREQFKKGVYKESKGAVVFEGEKYGLHTRVFITSQGLPTYEAKDVGLIVSKWRDYHFDYSIVSTASDIIEYMKVVQKSIEQFAPEMVARSRHVTHGNVKLAGGVKMSSRLGNFLSASDVLDITKEANLDASGKDDERVVMGAIKYAFLKQRIGPDITYLPEESVSLEGNSGPYLQYSHARASSILKKSNHHPRSGLVDMTDDERVLMLKMTEYPEVIEKAIEELHPHLVATYLYEIAQIFNRFYEKNRVIDDPRENERLSIIKVYIQILACGLGLLGIAAPDQL